MKVKDLVSVALFTALFAALGFFPLFMIPVILVPLSAQSLGPLLAGLFLGAKNGTFATFLFLLFVAFGFPLLTGMRGGMGVLLGPSGGFLIGWILCAAACGFLTYFLKNSHPPRFFSVFLVCIIATFIYYPIGIGWIFYITSIPLKKILLLSLLYLPGDFCKALFSALIFVKVHKFYPQFVQNKALRISNDCT